jgi:hypothetical protein
MYSMHYIIMNSCTKYAVQSVVKEAPALETSPSFFLLYEARFFLINFEE